ncbi:MAG: hypothetical protein V1837_02075 [Candidatus Woesearchaeota archaeon]
MSRIPSEQYDTIEKQILAEVASGRLEDAVAASLCWGDLALYVEYDDETAKKFYGLAKQFYQKQGKPEKVAEIELVIGGATAWVAREKSRIGNADKQLMEKLFS